MFVYDSISLAIKLKWIYLTCTSLDISCKYLILSLKNYLVIVGFYDNPIGSPSLLLFSYPLIKLRLILYFLIFFKTETHSKDIKINMTA